jgi:hypothetical protein
MAIGSKVEVSHISISPREDWIDRSRPLIPSRPALKASHIPSTSEISEAVAEQEMK